MYQVNDQILLYRDGIAENDFTAATSKHTIIMKFSSCDCSHQIKRYGVIENENIILSLT